MNDGLLEPSIETALQAWCQQTGIELCVLFGSRAQNRAHSASDVDLALAPEPEPRQRLVWQVELEDLLNAEVDVVLLTAKTEPILGWEIARNGRLIYEDRPGRWRNEQARLWHRYNDALPFRRGLANSLHRFAEEVRHAP